MHSLARAFLTVPALLICASTIPAQTPARPAAHLNQTDERVQHLPYSAETRFTEVTKRPDGTTDTRISRGSQARDAEGRTYSADERDWTYLEHGKRMLGKEMLYRIDDPVAHTDTHWASSTKEVKVVHEQGSTHPDGGCKCDPDAPHTEEKLGEKVIEGVVAEGTRKTYVAADPNKHRRQIIETWFSPELKIVALEITDDSDLGPSRFELRRIVRGEPDVRKYRPPRDYVVHDITDRR